MYADFSRKTISKKTFLKMPDLPGVYIYWNKKDTPVYVGKAKNLKNRLNSYLNLRLEEKTRKLMQEAVSVSVIKVGSEIEALLLEARLIRKFKPKYNIELKDDKNPLYILITDDEYPIIKTARKVDMKVKKGTYFGPFPSSGNVRFILKFIRRMIPYADHLPGNRKCIYSQIGLCDPCPSEIERLTGEEKAKEKRRYRENIRIIRKILSSKLSEVYKMIKKKMLSSSKIQDFEEARKYKEILSRLDYILTPIGNMEEYIENPNLLLDIREKELDRLRLYMEPYIKIGSLERIECFDIAHLMGQNPTASMVTFIKGIEDKSLYRRFKIYQKKGNSDVDSMSEVAKRRAKHLEDWGRPDLIIVDGGKTQLNVFKEVFDSLGIPVIGLAKRFETLVIKKDNEYFEVRPSGAALNLLQRLRDEAHRFARVYHHNLVTKTLLGSG